MLFSLSSYPLETPLLSPSQSSGAVVQFVGRVRNVNDGRAVLSLEYEAFDEMALMEGEAVLTEALKRFSVDSAICVHRVGHLQLGEAAIRVEVGSGHRQEGFEACRWIVDEIKARVPIWKREHYADGSTEWVDPRRPLEEAALYERQMRLSEVGEAGQAKFKAAKVLVVGAGGLGSAALPYLAAAGVGTIGICDDDQVDISNLHRQVLFGPAEVGKLKAKVAAAKCIAQNPFVRAIAHTERLTAANARELLGGYDLVLDCSDNLSTKFALNSAAVAAGKTLIVAGIYRYEGQLQVVAPGGPCLACLWEEQPSDGCVGSCAEVGVLGAVPGVLGSMQAVIALQLILGMKVDKNSVVIVDLQTMETSRIGVDKRDDCVACGAGKVPVPLEIVPDDLHDYRVVDVREAWELGQEPLPWDQVEWLPLSSWAGIDLDERPVLLVCRSGTRTAHLARVLRNAGVDTVFSLPGGLSTFRRIVGPSL